MIDFFKFIVKDSQIKIDKTKILMEQSVNVQTGEVPNYYSGEYQGLKIKLYETGFLIVSGSLHKFFNKGEHNHNQFDLISIEQSLNRISELLSTPLNQMILQNLEFGLNLEVPFYPKAAIDGFLYHNRVAPDIGFNGFYKEFKHNEYSIKLYDKSYQYKLNKRLLRCELRVIKSRWINKFLDIYTMNDLTDLDKLKGAKATLITKIDEIIQCYPMRVESVDKCEWRETLYWQKLDKRKRYQERKSLEKWKRNQIPDMPSLRRMIEDKFCCLTFSPFY